jgi:hypothetical protein
MPATFTNGKVTLLHHLVLGACVLAEKGPYPVDLLDENDIDLVIKLLDNNPTCPKEYVEALQKAKKEHLDARPQCPYCGIRMHNHCDSPPPDICHVAMMEIEVRN